MRAVLLGMVLVGTSPSLVLGQETDTGTKWALVIGVNKYTDPRFPALAYCANDASLVYSVLTSCCGFRAENVVLMTASGENYGNWPQLNLIVARLEALIREVKPGDTLLVFFSGHGVPLPHGGVVFATMDCLRDNPLPTGLPGMWLRRSLEKCRATRKMLILDCCHAAAVFSKSGRGVAERIRLQPCFEHASGLITLASSMADQLSHEWPKVHHGLFTYYLCRGLEGAADGDRNGEISVDELYQFLDKKVPATAFHELNAQQNPQRWLGPDTVGVFPLARLAHPDAAFPVRARKKDVWRRVLKYSERYALFARDASFTTSYTETQQQRIVVKQTDLAGRPTHLQVQFLQHEKTATSNLPGRRFPRARRGSLAGKIVAQELSGNGPLAYLVDDPDGGRLTTVLIHPLELDELFLPETQLATGSSTTDTGRFKRFLDRIVPEANVQLSEAPTITLTGNTEGGRVLLFEGRGRASACFAVPSVTSFDCQWRVEYIPTEARVRRIVFNATSSHIDQGDQRLTADLSFTVETVPEPSH